MKDSLSTTIANAHRALDDQFRDAGDAVRHQIAPREARHKVDTFLIASCRHAAAVCDVLLPAARTSLPDGKDRVHAYVVQCRRLECAARLAKRRLYGELHTAEMPWAEVWEEVAHESERLRILERVLAADLATIPDADHAKLAMCFEEASVTGPTRPHPYARHTGSLAHLSHRLWARIDRFWDAAEGRIVSGPGKKFKSPRTTSITP